MGVDMYAGDFPPRLQMNADKAAVTSDDIINLQLLIVCAIFYWTCGFSLETTAIEMLQWLEDLTDNLF